MKRIYVTGSGGLVGSRFVELLPKKYQVLTPEIDQLDITKKDAVKKFVEEEKPEIVVHFAAYTNVGEAQNQKDDKKGRCWKINVDGTRNLVNSLNLKKTHFIHISTDYVFPGSKEDPGPYKEDHQPEKDSSKLTWYGYTKAEAERVVLNKLGEAATILRLIYPVRAKYDKKLDYLRKPLALFDEGKLYPMFTDQQVSITFIDEACTALAKIIDGKHRGIFHASSRNTTSPYELISYLVKKARGKKGAVKKASLDEFLKTVDNPARYPKFGGLKVENTEKILGVKFSTWKQVVDEFVRQSRSK